AYQGVEHQGITCRGCEKPIFGVRHKCIECTDFDLCQDCISVVSIRFQHEYVHTFLPIEYPWDHRPFRDASVASYNIHPDVQCDGCGHSPVIGVRHKCLSCDDFNLCSACFDTFEKRSAHHVSHDFFPIRSAGEEAKFLVARRNAQTPSAFPGDHNVFLPQRNVTICASYDKASRYSSRACNRCNRLPVRHCCVDCSDYGLCTACVSNPQVRMSHNPRHHFTPLEPSTARLESGPNISSQHGDIESETKCGGCQRRGFRIRHHCLECPDLFLCQLCISSVRRRSEHGIRHRFLPIEYPWDVGAFEVVCAMLNAPRCRGCGVKTLSGWHKCLSCPDFALCSWCLSDPDMRLEHNLEHSFFPYAPCSGGGATNYKARRQQFAAYKNLRARWLVRVSSTSSDRVKRESLRCTRVFFKLAETSVCFSCDHIPWTRTTPLVTVPELIDQRIKITNEVELFNSNKRINQHNRNIIWGSIQMAASGIVPTRHLFRSKCSGPGEIHTLTPPTPSAIPLQCIHIGQGTIPNTLADIPCDLLPVDDLLAKLNNILGTSHTPLGDPDLYGCLKYALGTSYDFGEVYGTLRSEWSDWQWLGISTEAFSRMKRRRDQVQQRRDNAVRGHSIQNSRIPPRRVWDLYSNRVLPFHIIPWADYRDYDCMPGDLWTVSHSWVSEQEREYIMTPINGYRWPVPLPRGTSLDHIRIELLNMGAVYVWVDVLCLWQEGIKDDDEARLEEWKLDIPTIGHIYQAEPRHRPCITYFNGLGLPFDPSPAVLRSDRHWMNRVWTMQETLRSWLPGGLTATPHLDSPKFFSRLEDLLLSLQVSDAIRSMRNRHCTTELDRIAGLAYFLGCKTLPLYDRSASLESAWTLLIKHMRGWQRTDLFVQHESDVPFGLFISWAGFLGLTSRPALNIWTDLELVDPLDVHTNDPGEYHHATYATSSCYILSSPDDSDMLQSQGSGPQALQLHFRNHANPVTVQASAIRTHGCVVPNVLYHLLGVRNSDEFWVVAEVVGERDLRGKKALEVIKWGVIQMGEDASEKFGKLGLVSKDTIVVYLSSEEALARSKHVDEYMEAYTKAKNKS
ncbi:uncharacterized protein PHACADRAFT_91720, partial [Phanerochaete carnosa HHB-10118-sp]